MRDELSQSVHRSSTSSIDSQASCRQRSRFMTSTPEFDAPVRGRGFPSDYFHDVWYGQTRMVWLPNVRVVYSGSWLLNNHTCQVYRRRPKWPIITRKYFTPVLLASQYRSVDCVVERWSLTGELSLSCARSAVDIHYVVTFFPVSKKPSILGSPL